MLSCYKCEFLFSLVFLKKQFFIFRVSMSDVCLVSSDSFVFAKDVTFSPHVSCLVRLKDEQKSMSSGDGVHC